MVPLNHSQPKKYRVDLTPTGGFMVYQFNV